MAIDEFMRRIDGMIEVLTVEALRGNPEAAATLLQVAFDLPEEDDA